MRSGVRYRSHATHLVDDHSDGLTTRTWTVRQRLKWTQPLGIDIQDGKPFENEGGRMRGVVGLNIARVPEARNLR